MSEHRKALEQIMRICEESRTYTRRTQNINNVAMLALGMTANQRHDVHISIMDRIGDDPGKKAYLARKERARQKQFDDESTDTSADIDKTKEAV